MVGVALLALAAAASPVPAPWTAPAFTADAGAMFRASRDLLPPADAETDVLLEEEIVSFDSNGGRVDSYRIVFRPLTDDAARAWAVLQAWWNPWRMQRPELRARIIAGEKEVYDLDPATSEDSAANSSGESVFRDDRLVRAPLPAMKKGVLVEQMVTVRDREASAGTGFKGRLYLGRRTPVRESLYLLDAPASLPLRARVVGSDARPAVRVDDGRRRIALKLGKLDAVKVAEQLLPDDVAPWPHLSYSTGGSWQSVAAAYLALAGPQIAAPLSLWPEVAGLKAKNAPRIDVVGAALLAMHRMTRYTGVELGNGAVVPRTPEQTLQRRYGDCKDLATLLVAELKAAGIAAEMVLLRAGGEDIEADLPGLHAFNHAIVRVAGDPAIWVDPTAPAYAAGLLPPGDQDRLALAIDARTRDLVRTPRTPAAPSEEKEQREIALSELGEARVRVTLESTGLLDADRRELLLERDEAKRREMYTQFAKESFGARELASISVSDPADFSRPVRVEFEAKDAANYTTGVEIVEVRLDRAPLFRHVPGALASTGANKEPKQPERVHDLLLPEPHRAELRYRVIVPPGFTIREMPESKTAQLGPATLRQEFSRESDGAIVAEYQLDNARRRWSAAEVNAYRKGMNDILEHAIVLHLDQRGTARVASGRIREGLEEFRALAAMHPNEGLHHRQLATALIDAGAGADARAEARTAISLEPDALLSHTVAGYVLQHDLLGRLRRRGFDWAGAVAELKRAKELDAKSYYARFQLASLYERSPAGVQFGAGARLEEAIAEYERIRSDLGRHDADENLLAALWQAGRFEEVRKLAREMKQSADRDARLVGAVAALAGVQAAVDEANRLPPGDRHAALLGAGRAFLALGRFGPAADLMAQAGDGGDVKVSALVAALRRMDTQQKDSPPGDPRSVIGAMLRVVFSDFVDPAQVRELYSRHERELDEKRGPRSGLAEALRRERAQVPRVGMPGVMEALTLAMLEIRSEGDAKHGWRVRVRVPINSVTETYYMVSEGGRAKIVCTGNCPAQLGAVALELADASDVEGAQRWLDWARETIPPPRNPDSPAVINAFWKAWPTQGERGLSQARIAASILVALREANPSARTVLSKAIESMSASRERGLLFLALADLLSHGDALDEALEAVDGAARDLSELVITTQLRLQVLNRLARWSDARREANEYLERNATDAVALHAAAWAASATGDFDVADQLLYREIAAEPSREPYALNEIAWHDVCRGRATETTLANARRASSLAGEKNLAILNTLAAVDAVAGKTAEARQLFRKTIEQHNEDELVEGDWLVVGLLAEADGLPNTALAAYARIASGARDPATSVAAIARNRERALHAREH